MVVLCDILGDVHEKPEATNRPLRRASEKSRLLGCGPAEVTSPCPERVTVRGLAEKRDGTIRQKQ